MLYLSWRITNLRCVILHRAESDQDRRGHLLLSFTSGPRGSKPEPLSSVPQKKHLEHTLWFSLRTRVFTEKLHRRHQRFIKIASVESGPRFVTLRDAGQFPTDALKLVRCLHHDCYLFM